MIFAVAFFVVFIIGVWKTLEKAGQPGWGGLIPNLQPLPSYASCPKTGLVGYHVFHSNCQHCIQHSFIQ